MPSCCSVPGCRSNYSSSKRGYVPIFKFPEDPALKEKWEQSIRRKDFESGKYSGICILHFDESCIIRDHNFVNKEGATRRAKRGRIKLKPDACPTIFGDKPLPKLLPKLLPKENTTMEICENKQVDVTIAKSIATFRKERQYSRLPTLNDIKSYFCTIKAKDWAYMESHGKIFLFKVAVNLLGLTYIAAGIDVKEDKTFDVFFENVQCSSNQLRKHGIRFNVIESKSDVQMLIHVCDAVNFASTSSQDAVELQEKHNQVSKPIKRSSSQQSSRKKKSKCAEGKEKNVSKKVQDKMHFGNLPLACHEISIAKNEYEAIGMNVAAKLTKMDATQQIYAESLINKILTKGLLNKLTEDTYIISNSNKVNSVLAPAPTSTSVSKDYEDSS